MQKKYLLLSFYWMLFAAIAVSGKVVSFYVEAFEKNPVVISFEAFSNAKENVSLALDHYNARESLVSEALALEEAKKIEFLIARVEKNLSVEKKKVQISTPVIKKEIVEVKVDTLKNDGELFAIDNSQPFEAKPFIVERPVVILTVSLLDVPLKIKEEIKDEVKVAQAAPSVDEPVFLDYEDEEQEEAQPELPQMSIQKVVDQKIKSDPPPSLVRVAEDSSKSVQLPSPKHFDANLSPTVQRAIERELDLEKKTVSTQKTVSVAMSTQEVKKHHFIAETPETQLALSVLKVELNQNKGGELPGFEFDMGYDSKEQWSKDWILKSSQKFSVLSGKVMHKDVVRTRVNLPMKTGLFEMEIPAFSADSFEDFIVKNNIEVAHKGFLLIDVQEEIEQTLIAEDHAFERSFYLDENFVVVTDPTKARYHFYLGVEPGNVLVTYKLSNKKSAQKIVYVAEDELSFDFPYFANEEVKQYELYEQKLFGKSLSDLQIAGNDFRYFNTDRTSTSQGLNLYEINRPTLSLGMREYFEVGSKEDTVFVGTWDKTSLEVPGKDFRNAVYSSLGIEDLNGRCVVQLNLKKKIENVRFSGSIEPTAYYLDKAGEFSSEYNETTTQAFFLGNDQGVIDYRIDYLDGTSDLFQTYCSPGTYLVEQL